MSIFTTILYGICMHLLSVWIIVNQVRINFLEKDIKKMKGE